MVADKGFADVAAVLRDMREEDPGTDTVLALIAHDAKKDHLLRLVRSHRRVLAGFRLLTTGTTGALLAERLHLPVERMASGPNGGDLQIGARIVEGSVDALIFLRDPLAAHPHELDIQALLKVCDVHDVPVATNMSSAEILLHLLADYRREVSIRRWDRRSGRVSHEGEHPEGREDASDEVHAS